MLDEVPDDALLQALAVLRRPQHADELAAAKDVEVPEDMLDVVAVRGVRFARGDRLRILPGRRRGHPWLIVLEDSGDAVSLVCSTGARHLRTPRLPTSASGRRISELVPDGVARVELVSARDRQLVDVVDNVWEGDAATGPETFPDQVRWLDDAGRELARAV